MSNDFLAQWITRDERVDVALLSAPFTFPPVPSIALSIFQSSLKRSGISSKVIYASFPMIHLAGVETLYSILDYMDLSKNAEYLFAGLTDISASVPLSEFIRTFTSPQLPEEKKEELTELLTHALKAAEEVVEATARKIVHMGARIVAASSIYSQQNASLAVFKRVKELDPSVYTILGGYNVSGVMGMSVLRNFPSVDYVSFGEGDESIVQVCTNLLAHSDQPMPYGVVGKRGELPEDIPYRMTKDMNMVALPDYRDFVEETRAEAEGFYGSVPVYKDQTYEKIVFLEGSRGCWWGAKHPCTFCGLNGLNHTYREKSPLKLYTEIREMKKQYPDMMIQLSDNVLSANMIKELTPLLVKDPEQYTILAEIKTNMRSNEVRSLSEAGIRFVQPGIESLNDHLLQVMSKGVSAVQNVALLKYCLSFHVFPVWNLMIQVPGETREDYEQMLGLIPLVCHLFPPSRANPIVYMRFSGYVDHPEEYGLELKPDPLYRCCFKDQPDIENNMGSFFLLTEGSSAETFRKNTDLYPKAYEAVSEWRSLYFSKERPVLLMTENIFGLSIYDTRPCASEKNRIIAGLSAKVFRLAWEPVSFHSLLEQLSGIDEEKLKMVLDDLIQKKLMIFLSGKYLSLAIPNRNSK